MSGIAERLEAVRARLAKVTPRTVVICGVTKAQPTALVAEAIRAGVRVLGNNYVQEGEALREELGTLAAGVDWHFIGHIQSRKAKSLLDYAMVQSLERLSIAQVLEARLSRTLDVLVEVNVGGEDQKSGIAPSEVPRFLDDIAVCGKLRVRGLMAMPPPLEPVEARRPFFRRMRELFEAHAGKYGFDTLSMGTSADYLVAVEEGATMIRLGTTLFGDRPAR